MITPHFIQNKILPLLVDGDKLFYSKFNNKIYSATLPALKDEVNITDFSVSLRDRIAGKISFFNKLLRIGPHNFCIGNNTYLISLNKTIVAGNNNKYLSFSDFNGSRPLNIEFANKCFYFGEYFSNNERKEVKIFCYNTDKNKWENIYTFPANTIRHIHSIKYDSYRNGFWILTGDKDSESALWFTKDFTTLEQHGDWSQKTRAVEIIPTKDYIIVPMDTPKQKNFINYYYPKEKTFKQVTSLPGSAFHAKEIGEYYFVSTVVEPSVINKTNNSSIFICKRGSNEWKELFTAKKTMLPLKYSNYYRYPELSIVQNNSSKSKYLVAFGRSLKKYEAKTLVWDTSLL